MDKLPGLETAAGGAARKPPRPSAPPSIPPIASRQPSLETLDSPTGSHVEWCKQLIAATISSQISGPVPSENYLEITGFSRGLLSGTLRMDTMAIILTRTLSSWR
ncbi:hypothetical protein FKM82_002498 [Ascaphus truei]